MARMLEVVAEAPIANGVMVAVACPRDLVSSVSLSETPLYVCGLGCGGGVRGW